MLERRRWPRRAVAEPVLVRRDRRMDSVDAVDISLGGILLAGPEDLQVGDKVVIVLDGAERAATVVRVTSRGDRALIFD
jgi:hypothetical protein